ncbi:MAG: AAA family ATPase [Thermaerobacter sp.]|nr:AAA family ATPase [Thermaerobacter sp.]
MWKWAVGGVAAGTLLFLLAQGIDLLPVILLVALFAVVANMPALRGMTRRFAQPVKAGAGSGISFQDIGGQASAKKELVEALDFIQDPEAVQSLGIRPLKGILLTGPPGTGKTLLARAAAQYTGSAFIAAAGSEFIEMYAGVGAQRVRDLFSRARDAARDQGRNAAIIFIDEIEVLGGKRGQNHGHLEYDQTINQLLVEMDGLKPVRDDIQILVMAATNRADLLDEALTRPGRFDRIVRVDLPDREARREILNLHTRNKPLADDVDLDRIARETFGFSGAHLESLANEAAIGALRSGTRMIGHANFVEAVDKVIMGEKLDRRPTPEEMRRVALHEAGHALLAEVLRPGSVASITITSRGGALGYVRQAPDDDRYLHTTQELETDIAVALAGMVSEELTLGGRSTGAAQDFEQAFQRGRLLIFSGMSPLGVVSEQTLPEADLHRALTEIVHSVEERVRGVLSAHVDGLHRVADRLAESERMTGQDLRTLCGLSVVDAHEAEATTA